MSARTTRQTSQNNEYIESWDGYFLVIAIAVSRKSKDPRAMVGAVIVSPDKEVVSTGFNGLARRAWDLDELLSDAKEKFRWICHAEFNAVMNAARVGVRLKSCTIYVNKFPCFKCCNAIAQSGISRIVTDDKWYWDDDPDDGKRTKNAHSRKRLLLKQTGIEVYAPFHPDYGPDPEKWEEIKLGLNGSRSTSTNGKTARANKSPRAARKRQVRNR